MTDGLESASAAQSERTPPSAADACETCGGAGCYYVARANEWIELPCNECALRALPDFQPTAPLRYGFLR